MVDGGLDGFSCATAGFKKSLKLSLGSKRAMRETKNRAKERRICYLLRISSENRANWRKSDAKNATSDSCPKINVAMIRAPLACMNSPARLRALPATSQRFNGSLSFVKGFKSFNPPPASSPARTRGRKEVGANSLR
jgi:hypothetical protein